jgi:RuvB-like protein 2
MATIRGTTFRSPHGLPPDLLDRVLIISTSSYTPTDIEQIIQIRCQEEDVTLTPDALKALASTAGQTTLRYQKGTLLICIHYSRDILGMR